MSNKQERSFTGWVERPVWQRTVITIVLVVAVLVLLVLLNRSQ